MFNTRERAYRVDTMRYLDDLLALGFWDELAAFVSNDSNDKGMRIYARNNLRLAERRMRACGEYDRYARYLKG